MQTIYIDSEFKCHPSDDGSMTAIQTDFFDGKCDTFVEGFRCIPDDKAWVREDGEAFQGQIVPWVDYRELDAAQREYEQMLSAEYIEALTVLGVEV